MEAELAVTGFWLFLALIVVFIPLFRHLDRRSRDRLLKSFVEKDQPIPDELLKADPAKSRVSRGIVQIFLGIALAIFFFIVALNGGEDMGFANWMPAIGIIPFSVGLAMVFSYFAERWLSKRFGE